MRCLTWRRHHDRARGVVDGDDDDDELAMGI